MRRLPEPTSSGGRTREAGVDVLYTAWDPQMKFTDLAPGERFVFQDAAFRRTGPLTATRESDGKQRLMPRSAEVQALQAETPPGPSQTDRNLSARSVTAAFHAYHLACLACLEELHSAKSSAALEHAQAKLRRARQAFLGQLSLPS